MNMRVIFEGDIREKLSTIWTWHILDEQLKKIHVLCDVLLNNFKPCRFAPRVKNETEQAYHKIYLVYACQKI